MLFLQTLNQICDRPQLAPFPQFCSYEKFLCVIPNYQISHLPYSYLFCRTRTFFELFLPNKYRIRTYLPNKYRNRIIYRTRAEFVSILPNQYRIHIYVPKQYRIRIYGHLIVLRTPWNRKIKIVFHGLIEKQGHLGIEKKNCLDIEKIIYL